jgi:hypothetical protein
MKKYNKMKTKTNKPKMSGTLRFTFKLVFTSNVWQLDIDSSMTTADLITWINEPEMRQLFNIHEHYHIDIVRAGNFTYGHAELAPSIMVSFSETVGEKFNPETTSFYLRPVHPITEEFFRRHDYSVAPNYIHPTTPEPLTEMELLIPSLNSETIVEEISPLL